jgi:Protein of unknown function (DUF3048) N-terminal domain/Protein of unknown function (DUF3048) C-terminal domain
MPASGVPRAAWRPGGARTAAAAMGALALCGCVSSVASPVPRHPAATAGAAASPADGPSPPGVLAGLTGLRIPAAAADRPAIALAIAGRHPRGLASADLVLEEITRPSVRYIAVFQSRQAAVVGPITSTRPTDGMALSVLHPLYGYDGGTPGFLDVLRLSNVHNIGYPRHASLYQVGHGQVTTSTAAIWKQAARQRTDTSPPSLFQYRGVDGVPAEPAAAGQRHAASVKIILPGAATQTWQFDSATNQWRLTSGGPRVEVSDLIVEQVRYKTVWLSHKDGITAPSARVVGTGRADVLTSDAGTRTATSAGLTVTGNWSKPGVNAVTNFLDSQDFPLSMQPGPAWIILAPAGTRVLTEGSS